MKAAKGKCIVRFHQYRRDGSIIVPDKFQPQSVEATVVSDSLGELDGKMVICSLMDGTYFDAPDGTEVCTIKRSSVFMIFTEKDGKIATLQPLGRFVLTSQETPDADLAGFEIPSQFRKAKHYGRVFATGSGEWEFKPGSIIYFDWKRAGRIKIDGKAALLVPESAIHAVELEEAA